ncbi:dinitrogenase iron-molybdenum cofactor biosynthesis protein [candidate division KSB3 bacterium]|uniref:Dinitrogenase iron-molybdenum cofactor biosynthesis protein n=1 Tax=candidate division KSB3 bacterium TaxID=2044937 RepID=A0A2G6E746_9BACT|nr:MAG: dinitrogenase iron-molybdenum cofactor biosynthesis protein [candidate division KSB3 bacterium]PIE29990.1 MAG: dinitrogenase iron-molybdenum cofactor biosynthesis protein [candidate division KSB3 bacterium]
MKICVPVHEPNDLKSELSPHFGHAQHFAVLDDSNGELNFIENIGRHHGGTLTPAEILHEAGVDVLICGSLGVKALRLCQQFNIKVYNASSGTVEELIAAFKAGQLAEASEGTACHHDHAH